MKILFGLATVPLIYVSITGCGGVVTTAALPPPDVNTGTGNWVISGYYEAEQSILPYSFGGSLVNNNGQISGVFHINQPCFGSGTTDVPYTGTLNSKNNLSITSTPVNGQTLTFAGVLSGNGSSITNGNFKITGGCTGSIVSGTFPPNGNGVQETTAYRLPSLTGSWQDSASDTGLRLAEQFTQAATPDERGDYALTGTVTVQGSPCFTKGTVESGSFVSGALGQLIIKMDDGSTLQTGIQISFNGQLSDSIFGFNLYQGSVTGGACDVKWN
jgi:hypothetical protein